MPDYLGDDQRKVKKDDSEEKIQGEKGRGGGVFMNYSRILIAFLPPPQLWMKVTLLFSKPM